MKKARAVVRQRGSAPKAPPPEVSRGEPRFPIVGIGASAGGLEALELFLSGVPPDSGMAFVVVLHLDPTHKGIMPELLQRVTHLKVHQATDRARVQPDSLYVIPPNADMSILHGVLHLLEPVAARGLRLPIDLFFRSLAADRQEGGIAVILSGMGTDGTLGLRAIKEKAGVVFVQQPESARFDGMPRSAVDTGLADVVAPAQELPGKILAYLRHAPAISSRSELATDDPCQGSLEKVVILLRAQTGHDFSLYKRNTVLRRIERRMGLHQIRDLGVYRRFLQETPAELELLFKDLLIGVTSFFRDPSAWERLKGAITPEFLASRPPNQALRAWVPGCATGEEAYSLAMVFKEALEKIRPAPRLKLQIFATDLDSAALERARAGVFPANIGADVSAERLARFFVEVDGRYQVVKSLRESVIFAVQNVCADPPFTRLDLLSCRNLLIYLTPELQKQLMPMFHYALRPGGLLFLGGAESVGAGNELFAALDEKARLYRRVEATSRALRVESRSLPLPPSPLVKVAPSAPRNLAGFQSLAERVLLERFSPSALLVDRQGEVLYVSGRTGQYLEPAPGEANWNLFAMARDGLQQELPQAFSEALRGEGPIVRPNVQVETGAGLQALDLTVEALQEPEPMRGLVAVVFKAVVPAPARRRSSGPGKPAPGGARQVELERLLELSRRELRDRRDEMRTSTEEFKSTQEELQSANEELQSTNEELTTSREEMQSMNEELQTLNHELQAKVDDLSRTNSDVRNLLDSMENAVLFLDGALRLRLFTSGATRTFRLIPGDLGRPITDVANDMLLPELESHLQRVLQTLVFHEQQVATRDGRHLALRIVPYRTLDNVIDGVVLTLVDVTAARNLEVELRRVQASLQQRLDEQGRELDRTQSAARNR